MTQNVAEARLQQTPRCEATGLPLLISPFESRENGARFKSWSDYHHANSPASAPELQGVAGKARRASWGQTINRTIHNRYTHRFRGPDLDISSQQEFTEIVFACAGLMPRHVISIAQHESTIVALTDQQYATMSHPRMVHFQDAHHPERHSRSRATIGRYFAHVALSQEVSTRFRESTIEEFLNGDTAVERKKELGNQIITEAINVSLDDLVPAHQELTRHGYTTPDRYRPLRTTIGKFFAKQYFADYHETVTEQLKVGWQT